MSRRSVFDWLRTVMRDPDLTGAAKAVAWGLAEHASTNGVAWPSLDALATAVGIDERNVRKHVVALAGAAYLVVEDRRHLREPSWYWLADRGDLVGNFDAPPKARSTGRKRPVENEAGEGTEASGRDGEPTPVARPDGTVTNRQDESITHDRTEPSLTTGRNHPVPPFTSPNDPPNELPSAVREIFDHWRTVMDKPRAKLDDKRARAIRRALSAYDAETCRRAIDGCRASAWHMGENPARKPYNDITLILRDASKIEGFTEGSVRGVAPQDAYDASATPDESLASQVTDEDRARIARLGGRAAYA